MNCNEDVVLVSYLALASMLGTLILLVVLLWQSKKGLVPRKSILVLIICSCGHPYFWLDGQKDCGAELKTTAALFFVVALVNYLWTQYRDRFVQKYSEDQ